jgi:RHS repeat-associated protein
MGIGTMWSMDSVVWSSVRPPMPDNENADPADYGDADPQWEYFGAKHYFTIDSRKRSELLECPQQDAAEYVALQGISSQIGRIRPDNTREYYLKNHQGSLIKSVQASGEDMYILDYMAYGIQTLHHATDGDVPSEQYTGKEYDSFLAFYYYGARYFDPVLGMWSVPDPAGQFANPYYFGGDPVNYVDPDGEWIISALKIGTGAGFIINGASAIKTAFQQDSFLEGLGAGIMDLGINSLADVTAVGLGAVETVYGTAAFIGLGTASVITGSESLDRRAGRAWQGAFAPIQSDIATMKNARANASRGNYGQVWTNLAQSGTNSTVASYLGIQHTSNQTFGSGKYRYYGEIEISGGQRMLGWGQSTNNKGSMNAMNVGMNTVVFQGYYDGTTDQEKRSILLHESVHSRQATRHGTGGAILRQQKYKHDPARNEDWEESCYADGDCSLYESVFQTYGGAKNGRLNLLEVEAEMTQNAYDAGEMDEYYFDIPLLEVW